MSVVQIRPRAPFQLKTLDKFPPEGAVEGANQVLCPIANAELLNMPHDLSATVVEEAAQHVEVWQKVYTDDCVLVVAELEWSETCIEDYECEAIHKMGWWQTLAARRPRIATA